MKSDKHSEVLQQLKALLIGVHKSDGDLLESGVYDVHHQVRIAIAGKKFEFWDDDAFGKIEDTLDHSPKSPIDTITVKLQNAYCLVCPIRHGTFWILVYRIDRKFNPLLPYTKWQQQILELVQQLDDKES